MSNEKSYTEAQRSATGRKLTGKAGLSKLNYKLENFVLELFFVFFTFAFAFAFDLS